MPKNGPSPLTDEVTRNSPGIVKHLAIIFVLLNKE
jgi:hypothetical protein